MTELQTPAISRRRVLTTTGAAITGGAVVAFGSSGTASAQVTASPLDVPDASVEGEDGTVSSINLQVDGNYQYTVEAADTIVLSLMVAAEPDSDNWQTIDQTEETAMAPSTAGSYSLSGNVLDHEALSADQFSAEAAETATKEVPITVALDVMHGGEAVVSAIGETVATVSVTSTAVAVSAEVTGSGQMEVAV